MDELGCLSMASQDRLGLDAIKSLHRQLDDDADGNVDFSESDEVCMTVKKNIFKNSDRWTDELVV